jgi:hypothetical protein
MSDTKLSALSAVTNPTIATRLYAVATEGESSSATGGGSLRVSLANLLKIATERIFFPAHNEAPSAQAATLDLRNGRPVLDFDAQATEAALFTGVFPRAYGAAGVTVDVGYSMTSATGGSIQWGLRLERIGDQQLDVDGDSWATGGFTTAVTVPTTPGNVDVVSLNFANGSAMDSVAAGEQFRLRVQRGVNENEATAGASGDAELHWVRIREQ